MRTFLIILTTALLTTLGLIYAWTLNLFPTFFSFLPGQPIAEQASGFLASTGDPCTTPRWETVAHGEFFLSFANETGTIASGGCEPMMTVCTNWSRSLDQEPLAYETCTLDTPKLCDVNGYLFAHGTSQDFYAYDEDKKTCTSQTRTCTDGVVDGDEEYTYLSCPTSCAVTSTSGSVIGADATGCPDCPCLEKQPEIQKPKTIIPPTTTTAKPIIKQVTTTTISSPNEPNCPSPTWGMRREPGQQGSFYKQAVAPYGTTCEKVSVVCSRWSIRYGSKANPWDVALGVSSTCRVAAPVACASACGTIAHGAQVTTYKQSIIAHGNGQVCNDIKIVSTCTNGTLSPAWGAACSCQIAPPAWCTAPNGKAVAHGGSLTLYEYPQVQALAGDGADTCVRQRRQCNNGTFYDAKGNPASFTFKYETCSVIAPPPGGWVGGDGVPVGN